MFGDFQSLKPHPDEQRIQPIEASQLAALQPPQPVIRYKRANAGELLHIDTKRLGRIEGVGHRITGDRKLNRRKGKGWDAVHLAIVQTSLREWAYARPYESSAQRQAALQPFIDGYNWSRPHSALNHQPTMSRIAGVNNLLRLNN